MRGVSLRKSAGERTRPAARGTTLTVVRPSAVARGDAGGRRPASTVRLTSAGTEPALVDAPSLRTATAAEAGAIHALIAEHLAEGHLLPRDPAEVAEHAHRFVVAVEGDRVLACAELAPLSRAVAEVRSFVVSREARSLGIGRRIIKELVDRALRAGHDKLCAFTHSPSYFVHMGFSLVPHVWLPEKIATDCHACQHFRHCGQHAVVKTLAAAPRSSWVPLTAVQR